MRETTLIEWYPESNGFSISVDEFVRAAEQVKAEYPDARIVRGRVGNPVIVTKDYYYIGFIDMADGSVTA